MNALSSYFYWKLLFMQVLFLSAKIWYVLGQLASFQIEIKKGGMFVLVKSKQKAMINKFFIPSFTEKINYYKQTTKFLFVRRSIFFR